MSTDRSRPGWDLRVPTPDQLPAYMVPTHIAFAESTSGPAVDDWAKLLEIDRWLGAFEDPASEEPVGGAAALSLRLTVPGGEVPAAAVTAVGVRPDHRRRGVLSALMRRQLDDVHAGDEPVAMLWASEGAIYQRFGYGLATFDGSFEIASARTAFVRAPVPEGRVRMVTEEESRNLIPAVYEAMRTTTPGAITRSEDWWTIGILADPEYSREGLSEKYRVVYEVDGAAEGYAIYRVKPDWDDLGPKGVMEVREAVTTTPRALLAIWRYLFDVDLVRSIKAHRMSIPTPLQQLLAEPRALGLRINDGLWVRLVDLPAALGARGYATTEELDPRGHRSVLSLERGPLADAHGRGVPCHDGHHRGHDGRTGPGSRHHRPGGCLPGRLATHRSRGRGSGRRAHAGGGGAGERALRHRP